ncbi:MAG: 2-polyprenylphenol 6-hydroxylase, partial [Micropepsaceae bacterium]
SFIKLGQALSTRADLMGEDVAADLSGLQDRLPAFSGNIARATIAAELGHPVATLFDEFDDDAIAAASIAQVHFAKTKDGREVAVKVLRPGVEAQFRADLELFRWIARVVERVAPQFRRLRPIAVVETVAETVRLEMDLRLEAAAACELAQNFAGDPDFRVPDVLWPLTARRVMTTSRITGLPVDERDALIAAGHDPDAIIAKAARAFFAQVFRDGFFHADMHPGNLFVAPDGALVAVDFGIMGRIDPATRNTRAEMLIGVLAGDYGRVAAAHLTAGYVPQGQSAGAFAQAARAIAEPILGKPLNEISLARLLAQLFEVTEQFNMETQPQLLLLQKSMLVCEGVGRRLNPQINMWTLARPLIEDWAIRNQGPDARIAAGAAELIERLKALPAFLANLEKSAAMLAEGGVRLHPDTLAALGGGRRSGWWPWIVAAAAVIGLVWVWR